MFDKNLMKLDGMRNVMMALFALALLQSAFIIGWAHGLTDAVCLLWDGEGVEEALPSIYLFAVCFIVMQVIRFGQETMLDRFSLDQAYDLREKLLGNAFDQSALLSLRVGATRVAAVANDGIDEVQTYVRIIPPKIVGMVAVSVPLLVCAFALDWVSGIILAVMFPVIIFFMILLGRQARERSERQYATYTLLTNRFMDTLRGLGVIKAFGATQREAESVYENSESVRKATVRTLRTATLSSVVLDLCATFGVAAVAIMLAFRLMDGSVDLYTGLLVLVLSPEYFAPIRSFASDYHASLDGKNALAAVLELEDIARNAQEPAAGEPEDGEGEDLETEEGAVAASTEVAEMERALSAGEIGSLSFEGVGYRYDDGTWGVRDVSFYVGGFDKVAVVGKSGSGKSTLAKLFAGFTKPDEGRVYVNGAPMDLTSPAWKRLVRYIPQDPYIFRATLDENIRFYQPYALREDVLAVVSAVGLDALVDELPDGLDTMVGEGARGLSGGEAHRVALARILLDDGARVLVFDEPTAHLDIETERDLKGPMLAVMQDKLVLFATHRLHWLADMDRVIELEADAGKGWEPMAHDEPESAEPEVVETDDANNTVEGADAPEASDVREEVDAPEASDVREEVDAPEASDVREEVDALEDDDVEDAFEPAVTGKHARIVVPDDGEGA